MFGPIIEGERIRLVPPTEAMFPIYFDWFSDREVTRYMGRATPPGKKAQEEWFGNMAHNDTDILWAVVVGDKHIGSTGIHQIDWRNQRALTGNMIGDKSEWGKGYGSEAVRLRTEYAFTNTTLEKLQTDVFTDNVASQRCLEKAGYRQYGVARRHVFRNGKWHDMWLADVLREEWLAMRAAPGR